jgi:hypothetical protein
MPITFDSLEELIRFSRSYQLVDDLSPPVLSESDKPRRAAPAAEVYTAVLDAHEDEPKRRGRRPNAEKENGQKPYAEQPVPKPRRRVSAPGEETLTSKIRRVISSFIEDGQEFTANRVYDVIAKQDAEVNKQSVITSVLKQMNSADFSHIRFEERPGNGPRPVKVYIP